MQPKTIQDARSDGAITGTMISAPLAPAMGPITIVPAVVRATADAPAKEPMVVLTVKAFWDSPTVIKARRILIGCATIGVGAAGTILKASLDAGTNVWQLPWGAAGTAFVSATVAAALTVFFVWQKLTDNNPVQK